MQRLEDKYWQEEDVVFLYIQTVFEGHSTNTWDEGLGDLDAYGIQGPYGFDPSGPSQRPATMSMFDTGGTPYSVVINRRGKTKLSDFTPDQERLEAVIEAAL